jgi:hypothetical protein
MTSKKVTDDMQAIQDGNVENVFQYCDEVHQVKGIIHKYI